MISPLEHLAAAGNLKRESPDKAEYEGLVHSGRLRLADAENPTLALVSRFDLAYNAAHALSLAALRRHGYRSENRYVVFQALAHTLGLEAPVWRVLDAAHKRRNRGEYHGNLHVTERMVAEIVSATKTVLAALDALAPPL
jgi:hypothetical protein